MVATASVICVFGSSTFLGLGGTETQKEITWCAIWRNRIVSDLNELNTQITEAAATIDNAMLGRVWQELDYRLAVCCVTNDAHIEHLSTFYVKIEITSFLNLPDVFLYP